MVIGAFGPWVTALGASISGTDGTNDGWLVVGAAAVGVITLLALRRKPGWGKAGWLLIVAGASTLVTIHDRQNVSDQIKSSNNELVRSLVHVGWGLTTAIIASISLAAAAVSLLGVGPLRRLDVRGKHRECPHCKEPMRRDASVCPHCQRDSEAWTYNDGAWWLNRDDTWLWLDESTGEWTTPGPDEIAEDTGASTGKAESGSDTPVGQE
jgi:hypothetical protein